jgi:hypothetical protein
VHELDKESAGVEIGQTDIGRSLVGVGFDCAQPSLWILEGLTMYLSRDENYKLLQDMATLSAPGSMWLSSMVPESLIGAGSSVPAPTVLKSTWRWGFNSNFPDVRISIACPIRDRSHAHYQKMAFVFCIRCCHTSGICHTL